MLLLWFWMFLFIIHWFFPRDTIVLSPWKYLYFYELFWSCLILFCVSIFCCLCRCLPFILSSESWSLIPDCLSVYRSEAVKSWLQALGTRALNGLTGRKWVRVFQWTITKCPYLSVIFLEQVYPKKSFTISSSWLSAKFQHSEKF